MGEEEFLERSFYITNRKKSRPRMGGHEYTNKARWIDMQDAGRDHEIRKRRGKQLTKDDYDLYSI